MQDPEDTDADAPTTQVPAADAPTTAIPAADAPTTQVPAADAPTTPVPAPPPPRSAPAFSAVKAEPTRVPPRVDSAVTADPAGRNVGAKTLLIALAAIVILGVGAILLFNSYRETTSPQAQIQSSIDTFVGALDSGDLTALRSITCGALAEYYNGLTAEQFAAVHSASRAQQSLPVVGPIDALTITGDSAIAQVPAHTVENPNEQSWRTFDLTFADEQWKICEPQNTLSDAVPK